MKKRIFIILIMTALLLTACIKSEKKDQYPTKSITMVVPYGAGGTTDLVGRRFAASLEKVIGEKITVINQPGASGSIGTKTVLDADSDGYTLLFTADSLGTQRVMGLSKMSYDDFVPIMTVADDPKVIVVNKDSEYEDLSDLFKAIKDHPGKIRMSYTGPGGSGHVQSLIFNKFGMEMALTAYSSGMDGIVSVLSRQVDFTNANFSTVAGYIESGELKLLGVSANERLPKYPDVPTFSEIIPESKEYMEIPFTPLSLVVSKEVPQEVVNSLREAAKKAVEDPEFIQYMDENSIDKLYLKYKTPEEMTEFFKSWESKVSWLLHEAGVTQHSPEEFGISKP